MIGKKVWNNLVIFDLENSSFSLSVFIWVTRGLYSSMNTMFTFVYDKENGHQQDNSCYVYIFTENALKRLHKLQFCLSYHISRLSNVASCFLICVMVK